MTRNLDYEYELVNNKKKYILRNLVLCRNYIFKKLWIMRDERLWVTCCTNRRRGVVTFIMYCKCIYLPIQLRSISMQTPEIL